MTSSSWLSLHRKDFFAPIQTGNICNNQHAGISTAQRGSDASPSKLWKNMDNKAISSNYGKSVTSVVLCLCKAKAVMKDASITDEDIGLNKIRQVNQPNQGKYFHKEGSVKGRLQGFLKMFLISFHAHAVFQINLRQKSTCR